jgi:alkaline phosphatase
MFIKTTTFLAALFNVVVMLGMVSAENDSHHKRSPSVIVLIPDGFGASQATLAREFLRVRDGLDERFNKLAFDDYHVGSIMTKSANNLVTDSAAAGTAFACGANTYNGIIGYDDEIEVCPTVLEGAKAKGYRTGLVTTTRITHATPAAYSSHVYDRNLEADIAAQQLGEYVLGPQVDLLWGGGRSFFTPASANGSRVDERDLVAEAKEKGWNVVLSKEELEAYKKDGHVKKSRISRRENWGSHLPSLGLFADSHLDYEIDRVAEEQPSLAEMTVGALDALDADDKPFFLMVCHAIYIISKRREVKLINRSKPVESTTRDMRMMQPLSSVMYWHTMMFGPRQSSGSTLIATTRRTMSFSPQPITIPEPSTSLEAGSHPHWSTLRIQSSTSPIGSKRNQPTSLNRN